MAAAGATLLKIRKSVTIVCFLSHFVASPTLDCAGRLTGRRTFIWWYAVHRSCGGRAILKIDVQSQLRPPAGLAQEQMAKVAVDARTCRHQPPYPHTSTATEAGAGELGKSIEGEEDVSWDPQSPAGNSAHSRLWPPKQAAAAMIGRPTVNSGTVHRKGCRTSLSKSEGRSLREPLWRQKPAPGDRRTCGRGRHECLRHVASATCADGESGRVLTAPNPPPPAANPAASAPPAACFHPADR